MQNVSWFHGHELIRSQRKELFPVEAASHQLLSGEEVPLSVVCDSLLGKGRILLC